MDRHDAAFTCPECLRPVTLRDGVLACESSHLWSVTERASRATRSAVDSGEEYADLRLWITVAVVGDELPIVCPDPRGEYFALSASPTTLILR